MSKNIIYHWFRRDLRLEDNAGLYHALKSGIPVQCIFIFDENILSKLPRNDARLNYLHTEVTFLSEKLEQLGSSLLVKYGDPITIWEELTNENKDITAVYTNKDFEVYAKERDEKITKLLNSQNIKFNSFKDHVIFEGNEVLKDDGKPYTVFTPYKKKWLLKLLSKTESGLSYYFKPYPNNKYFSNLIQNKTFLIPSLETLGFVKSELAIPSKVVKQNTIVNYAEKRNFPSIEGTSRLGLHFRFGTISIRQKAYKAQNLSETFLSELIWRDFYAQILDNFPHVAKGAFRPEYENIEWVNDQDDYEKWKNGMTGYPIVDAGMRELNSTGHMHNRVRMIVASFLTKHLLIDWKWGEAYFAEKLLDFDLASNNGGWQWAAGCGTDAAPYFRIFSPDAQEKKFDSQAVYIKRWVKEFGTPKYPKPIVDHKMARERCLNAYKKGLGKS
jgi:deoxyribodipyrimidine photo-lyase